ncbi:MAG: hypothetical protein IJ087_13425 [Eggerthellaceae bacterium]|nr:hypothetical protein [Eggerthellaceae bacterium]
MSTLTVKPGEAYLLVAAILFAMVLAGFLAMVFSDAVRGSSNPAESFHAALLFLILFSLPSAAVVLFWKWTVYVFDDEGMVARRLLRPTLRYRWADITDAKVARRDTGHACSIYSHGKKVAKIPLAFEHYMQLLDLLVERGLLTDGEAVEEAKFGAALRRVTFEDLRDKDEPTTFVDLLDRK